MFWNDEKNVLKKWIILFYTYYVFLFIKYLCVYVYMYVCMNEYLKTGYFIYA